MSENFIIASRTDVGKARQGNEDSMVTFDSPNGRVVAVCDGMGGMAAGDVASKLACDIITDILTNNKFATPTEAITKAMQAANQGILYRTQQNPELEGMGATCVMVIIRDGMVYYGWVGDSRIYYIYNGTITQLTRDQSHVQEMVDSGEMSSGEADVHPLKNEITNALGIASMRAPELCTTPIKPDSGSVVLLCSDGLTGMVDNNTICNVVSDGSMPLQQRADQLVDIANANGGQDNITVELVQFGGAPVAAMGPAPERGHGREMESKGGEGSKWMVWAAVLLGLIILGAGAWYIWGGDSDKPDEPAKATNMADDAKDEGTSDTEMPSIKSGAGSKGRNQTTNSGTKTKVNVNKKETPVTVQKPKPQPTTPQAPSTPKAKTTKTNPKPSTSNLPGVEKSKPTTTPTQTPPAPTTKPEPKKPSGQSGNASITNDKVK